MQIVIRSMSVTAVHADVQDLSEVSHYKDCLVITVPDATPVELGQTWAMDLPAFKDAVCSRIESARLALERAGVWINWPDGARSKIQTRDDRDWRNINGVASRGLARLTQALTDADWFRDADNVDHELSPTQALDLGYQASAAISVIARVAQAAKDAIRSDAVATEAAVLAIEAAIVWPE